MQQGKTTSWTGREGVGGGGVKGKHRDVWNGDREGGADLMEAPIIHWRCWHSDACPVQEEDEPPTRAYKHATRGLLSWQQVSNDCGTLKTLKRKRGRPHSSFSRSTERTSYVWISQDNRAEKPSIQTGVRCEGPWATFLSFCQGLTETLKVNFGGLLVHSCYSWCGDDLTKAALSISFFPGLQRRSVSLSMSQTCYGFTQVSRFKLW